MTIDELVVPLGELHELVSNSEDPYFELENERLSGVERLLGNERVIAGHQPIHSEVRYGWWLAARK